jgi:hypothetical protein
MMQVNCPDLYGLNCIINNKTIFLTLAMPEDAVELSYIEICKGNEYKELNQTLDTWNITTCPSK